MARINQEHAMADGLTVDVVSDQISAGLQALQVRLGDLTPLYEDIGEQLESRVHQRFDLKVDPGGQRWAKWTENTAARYTWLQEVKGEPMGTLMQRSGHMRDGLSWLASNTALLLGFDRIYAVYHETGTRKMTRRGLLLGDPQAGTLAAPDEELVMATIDGWLSG